jgi:hypothetical protein
VKGEWRKGNLIYAEINKFKPNPLSDLKKEKVVFNVRQERDISVTTNRNHIEVIGPAEVSFLEKSTSIIGKPEN